MSKMIKIKRGLDSARANYQLQLGEMVWATDTEELWVGDGLTIGGIKVTAKVENNYIPSNEKGIANGVATLGPNSKILDNQLPSIAITEVHVVGSEQEMIALPAQTGDVAIRTDENDSYIRNNGNSGDIADWTKLLAPLNGVQSINGLTGTVILNLDDINDATFTSLNDGDFLMRDGSNWVNSNVIDGGAYGN